MLYRTIDPWREINEIQREMNRLFNNSYSQNRLDYPAINLWTNADNAMVTAELPGYSKEDVDISLIYDVLRIRGSRKAPECKENECFHRQERNYGLFDREIKLPFLVDAGKIDAVFKDGILRIHMPRAEQDKPKKIDIQVK